MSDAKSALETLYENRDAKCKNPECNHAMSSHVNFKMIKEDRIPLLYCAECRGQGQECKLTKF